jgi:hypothetical protein
MLSSQDSLEKLYGVRMMHLPKAVLGALNVGLLLANSIYFAIAVAPLY